jgi:hypothetical protein
MGSGTIQRWNGSEFVAGGTLRRWDGNHWQPDPNPWTPVIELSPVLLWVANTGSIVGPAFNTYGSVPLVSGAAQFGAGRLETTDVALDLGASFTITCSLRSTPTNADGMAWMFGQEAPLMRRALWVHHQTQANYSGYNANVIADINMGTRKTITIRKNGPSVQVLSGTALLTAGAPQNDPYTYIGFALGGNAVTGTEIFNGEMWNLAAFNRSLTDPELAILVDALVST